MNRMRCALFYNRANGEPVVTAVPAHAVAVARGKEAEAIGAVGIALVGRRAPIEAALSNEVRRRPVTPTGRRQEDGLAVLAGYFVALMPPLRRPCPGALGFQLFEFSLGR